MDDCRSLTDAVKSSAQFIREHSKYVHVDVDKIRGSAPAILSDLRRHNYSAQLWRRSNPLHPQTQSESALDWIFLCDSMNFSFWLDEAPFSIAFQGHSGYWAYCAMLWQALRSGVRLDDPGYLLQCENEPRIRAALGGLPLLEQRVGILKENAQALVRHFGGRFANCLARAGGQVDRLLELIVFYFPSFRDEAVFEIGNSSRRVCFLKRAQILVADIWACFEGQAYGAFDCIEALTMFADYRVPQTLQHLGFLCYAPELRRRLQNREQLLFGAREEMEIRGNSIFCIEILKEELAKCNTDGFPVNAVLLDFYLWDLAKNHPEQMAHAPIHLTRSIYY